ncbi:MAG: calcium-translocating P-type ATPase, SERCA-type [Clostridia bacterium]|nr:calcium-translocating P-type ATPase, SERCA-type [Clostridia bacterium]
MRIDEVMNSLKSDSDKGLTEEEAQKRLTRYGLNILRNEKKISPVKIFLHQFRDAMVLILIGATLISGMLGEYADALTILTIVVINAVLGLVQEYRAEKSIEALRRIVSQEANVIRDGLEKTIPAGELVPGDIVVLKAGDKVPADIRLLKTRNLQVEESALTGESVPVSKDARIVCCREVGSLDQKNFAFMGTLITRGRGRGIVANTGMRTEVGRIAGLIQEAGEMETPLQKRLDGVGKRLVLFCLVICAIVTLIGIARGIPAYKMFLAGVSLAVAAIPEGLPAIVTVALAIGVQKMLRRKALVRKLPAVETLGCTTVICSDKTGTLTKNEMTVRNIWVDQSIIEISGEGYSPRGDFLMGGEKTSLKKSHGLKTLLKIAALCNNARLVRDGVDIEGMFRKANWSTKGDPTKGALLVAAAKGGIWRERIEEEEQRIEEIPFDSDRKRMSVIYRNRIGEFLYTKGAPDVVLERCKYILSNGSISEITKEKREKILNQNLELADRAMRVLALAYREVSSESSRYDEDLEKDLVFVGLAAMIDPPRPEVTEAIKKCYKAGIRTVMITGDHPSTAAAVAKEIGLTRYGSRVVTGKELGKMSEKRFSQIVEEISVYARVSPKDKLRIIRTLKGKGHIVAMTGDGVNDAPAVKEANIGIAMGIAGTDVTKEASSMILLDDNFSTIISATEEGRVIYDNIRKFIRYMLACNIGEVMVVLLAMIIGLPLPLIPIQILFVNLVTDGLPAMALGLEKGEPDVMERPPRRPDESIFSGGLARKIISKGVFIGLGTLSVFILGLILGEGELDTARTMAFCTLVFFQLFYVFECKSSRGAPLITGLFSNPYLIVAVLSSIIAQLAVVYMPFFQTIFKTVPLNSFHWTVVLAVTGAATILNMLYQLTLRPIMRRIISVRI